MAPEETRTISFSPPLRALARTSTRASTRSASRPPAAVVSDEEPTLTTILRASRHGLPCPCHLRSVPSGRPAALPGNLREQGWGCALVQWADGDLTDIPYRRGPVRDGTTRHRPRHSGNIPSALSTLVSFSGGLVNLAPRASNHNHNHGHSRRSDRFAAILASLSLAAGLQLGLAATRPPPSPQARSSTTRPERSPAAGRPHPTPRLRRPVGVGLARPGLGLPPVGRGPRPGSRRRRHPAASTCN